MPYSATDVMPVLPFGVDRSAVGWVFESLSQQTKVVKTGNDSSTAKRPATGVGVMGSRR